MTDEKKECAAGTAQTGAATSPDGRFAKAEDAYGRRALLLHSCCGPCSTSVIERLADDYNITVFYFNPCITDPAEYRRRRENQIRFIEEFNRRHPCADVKYIDGEYEPAAYLERVKGLENEPEGGARCEVCFMQRLDATAKKASALGFPLFTTTLTVSPHKNYKLIAEIARGYAAKYGVEFLDCDFKKKAGFQRSVQLSREYGLYRQDYCGCEFSKR